MAVEAGLRVVEVTADRDEVVRQRRHTREVEHLHHAEIQRIADADPGLAGDDAFHAAAAQPHEQLLGRSIPALVRAPHALEHDHLRRRHFHLRRALLQLGIAAHEDVQEDEIGVVHHLDVVARNAVDLDQAEQRLPEQRRPHVVLPELADAGQREVEEAPRGAFDEPSGDMVVARRKMPATRQQRLVEGEARIRRCCHGSSQAHRFRFLSADTTTPRRPPRRIA